MPTNIEGRVKRLEAWTAPAFSEYRDNPQFSPEANAHFARIHGMLEGLGPRGVENLLADIAVNGGRLVAELAS